MTLAEQMVQALAKQPGSLRDNIYSAASKASNDLNLNGVNWDAGILLWTFEDESAIDVIANDIEVY